MTKSIRPQDLNHYIDTHLLSTAGVWLSGIAGLGLLAISATTSSFALKTTLQGTSLVAVAAGAVSRKVQQDTAGIRQDTTDISNFQRQQALYGLLAPAKDLVAIAPETSAPYQPKKLATFRELVEKRNKFPHIMVLAGTGEGKSTLASWMLSQFSGARRVAISPHHPDEFTSADEWVGTGRDYGAIASYMTDLVDLMDERYKLSKSEMEKQQPVVVLLDELPSIAKNVEGFSDLLLSLIAEARKARIYLILLTQGDGVKTLKMEGESAMRDQLAYLRLGSNALEYASTLASKKRVDSELVEWLENLERPAMLENLPIMIPDLSTWSAPITVSAEDVINNTNHLAVTTESETNDRIRVSEVAETVAVGDSATTPVTHSNPDRTERNGVSATFKDDPYIFSEDEIWHQTLALHLEAGKSMSEALKRDMGYHSRHYGFAKEKVQELEAEWGEFEVWGQTRDALANQMFTYHVRS